MTHVQPPTQSRSAVTWRSAALFAVRFVWRRRVLNVSNVVAVIVLLSLIAPGVAAIVAAAI